MRLESRFYNKELNTNFWKDGEFCPTVRDKLLQVVDDFIDMSDIDIKVDDIQLTGSLANYNYTKYSDLDVHVLTTFSRINSDTNLVKRALDGKRFIWNLRHNIIIRDHEVELYFQDTLEPHIASGLFSLLNNKWLKSPKYDPPDIDEKDVDKKSDTLAGDIDRLESMSSEDLSPEDAKRCYKKAVALKRKIGHMRRAGLHRDGEFSIENLAFKNLRNTGAIGSLIDVVSNTYSKIYSEGEDAGYFYRKPHSTPSGKYGDSRSGKGSKIGIKWPK